jgi:Rrf2 family protein
MVYMARLGPGGFAQARDLARAEDMPAKFLEAVLLQLKRAGFLESKVGSGGGYKLTRPPRQVRIADVVRQLEDDPELVSRADASPGELAVRVLDQRFSQAQSRAVDDLSLEDLVEEASRLGRSKDEMYYI